MIRSLSRKGIVLAIDADPNSNLPDKLGIGYDGTIGGMRNDIVNDPDRIPAGISKHEYMTLAVRSLMAETDRMDMLVMGRPEGEGCYCFTNNVLKECFSEIIPKYDFTVIDNEAGMEHLSRKVIPSADVLILVSDPTVIGVRTAERLMGLSREVGIETGKTILVINNSQGIPESLRAEADSCGFDALFEIPHDDLITKTAMESAEVDLPPDSEFARSVEILISAL